MTTTPDKDSPNNVKLRTIDDAVTALGATPEIQIGVLQMALVLAFRRFLDAKGITDRGRRMKLIKFGVAEYEAKLRQFVRPDAPQPAADAAPEAPAPVNGRGPDEEDAAGNDEAS